ncbi:BA14K family protein [Pararhizobium arenae]|jgi:hypothetical protein|uniref:BA14K family protein n=1 Tax=Pararhizobium arenae TaxID=1856850 RepID=UPI00094B32D8|nr:BA14K family protein [Pararhizobium arenae]
MKKIAVVFVALATAFTGVVPAHAFPGVPAISAPQAKMPGVEEVRDRRYVRRHHRHDRRYDRRWRHGRHHYHHRYHHRRNYAGAIIGGLAAGAIIGGIVNAQPRRYYAGNSHASWCYNRYRSYRAYDNTYQPYNGPRRQCVSPY